MLLTRFSSVFLSLGLLFGSAIVTLAQSPFSPVIEVNESVVTQFEIDQRRAFLELVSPAQASEERAREGLIEDKLRNQAAAQFGFTATEDDIIAAMTDFAARGELELDAFINILASNGIAVETFRDFVTSGIGWRDLVRARFGNRVQITQEDIDRALAASTQGGSINVLLSEIIIPAPPQRMAFVMEEAERISQIRSADQFSNVARQVSATASRDNGGRLDWTPISRFPATLRPILLSLAPGEVSDPIPLENAVALFQLRGIQETGRADATYGAIEYAQYLIPGGRSEAAQAIAARVSAEVDVCDDLYGVAFGEPEEQLVRETLAPADIPRDIALELAKLDDNEISTALVTSDGTSLILLMLCSRTAALDEEVSQDAIANQLRQERFEGFSDSYLEQLRADARIRFR